MENKYIAEMFFFSVIGSRMSRFLKCSYSLEQKVVVRQNTSSSSDVFSSLCTDFDGVLPIDKQIYLQTLEDLCYNSTHINESICNELYLNDRIILPCVNGCFEGACKCSDNINCPEGYVCGSNFLCILGARAINTSACASDIECEGGRVCNVDTGECQSPTTNIVYSQGTENSCKPLKTGGNYIAPRSRVAVESFGFNLTLGEIKEITYLGEKYEFLLNELKQEGINNTALLNVSNENWVKQVNATFVGVDFNPPTQILKLVSPNDFQTAFFRLESVSEYVYCDVATLTYMPFKNLNLTCLEDYECASNSCLDGKCTSVRDALEEQRGLILGIWCALVNFFGLEDEDGLCTIE